MFMTSSSSLENPNKDNTTSGNCGAGCKIKPHSILAVELCGDLAVTEAATEYIWNHVDSLFSLNPPSVFQVKIGLDSECILWTLHPEKPQKLILIRNGVRKIHTTLLI